MDNFTHHQLLLMKLRDDFCAGNAAELARRKSASDCLGRMGVKYKEIYPAMATKSHAPPRKLQQAYWLQVFDSLSTAHRGGFLLPALSDIR